MAMFQFSIRGHFPRQSNNPYFFDGILAGHSGSVRAAVPVFQAAHETDSVQFRPFIGVYRDFVSAFGHKTRECT